MSTSLTDDLMAQLQGAPVQRIASQLGIGADQAQNAIGAALPLLLGAMGRNAAEPQGAQALFGALQRDHAAGGPDLGGLLGALLGGGATAASPRQTDGAAILGHILGNRLPQAEAGIGQASGLNTNTVQQLLSMLAPLVMSFLAQRVQQGGLDAGALGATLGQERSRVAQQGGLGGSLLNAVLDQDGDGQVGLGDLVKLGAGLFGGRR